MEPLFIVGSSRSGTTLISKLLSQSGQFAAYNAEPKILYGCDFAYGDIKRPKNKQKFFNDFIRSRQFSRSYLTEADIRDILYSNKCNNWFDFHQDFMEGNASLQGKKLWMDSTPENVFILDRIVEKYPNAKVINMVRDGRAVSLSRAKLKWTGLPAINFNHSLILAAIQWERSVAAFNEFSENIDSNVLNIRYEDLVTNTRSVMMNVFSFVGLDLVEAIDRLDVDNTESNSIFSDMGKGVSDVALYRWKNILSTRQINLVESIVADTLKNLGYELVSDQRYHSSYKKDLNLLLLRIADIFKNKMINYSSTPLEIER